MKKDILSLACTAIAILSFTACNKESAETIITPSEDTFSRTITMNAVQDGVKVLLTGDNTISFVDNDKISGFDTKGNRYTSEKAGTRSQKIDFTFNNWSDTYEPAYFVFNNTTQVKVNENICIVGDDIELKIPDSQQVWDKNSFSRFSAVLVGAAENNDGKYSSTLKNVCGYVRVAFENCEGIHAVSLASKDGEPLAGLVHVSKTSIDEGAPVASVVEDKGVSTVTITPMKGGSAYGGEPEEGEECFLLKEDGVFYFAVLPGEFTPVLTFTDVEGRTSTVTASKPITVERAGIYDLKTVDMKLNFEHPVIDDDIEINLDFIKDSEFNWDLTPACPVITDTATVETEFGEVYHYDYEGKYPLAVTIFKGKNFIKDGKITPPGYYNYKTGLKFNALQDWIGFPVIPGKKLSEVTVTHANSSAKYVNIVYGNVNTKVTITSDGTKGTHTFAVNYPGEVKILRVTSQSIVYSNIKLKYVPADEIPATVTIGFAAGETPSRTGIGGADDSMDKAFLLDGYMFRPSKGMKCYWRGSKKDLFLTNSSGYLILPKFMGYRLSMIHMESVQETEKNWQIRAGKTFETSKNLQVFKLCTASPADIQVNDPYCSENEYYLNTTNSGVSISALLLTYEKLK